VHVDRDRWPLPAEAIVVAAAGATLAATAAHAVQGRLTPTEAALFEAVNGRGEAWLPVIWLPMQAGALGAVPAAVALAWYRQRDIGFSVCTAAAGLAAYLGAKLFKNSVRRGRPSGLHGTVSVRFGGTDVGNGYPSGHAAVTAALLAATWPRLTGTGRMAGTALAAVVGLGRIYVGAHLPSDVAGGWAMGIMLGLATRRAVEGAGTPSR